MMKKVLVMVMMMAGSMAGYGQMGEWTWMNGDSTANSLGHYGMQGVFDSLNTPPSLYQPCEWTDKQGNFWLFGGTTYGYYEYSDLWKFDPSINEWAWMKGPGIPDQPGVYGIQNISSTSNNPGIRFNNASWVDTSGDLWLFGGFGFGASTIHGCLSDLWRYNVSSNEWTWMNGPNTVGDTGNYGTILIPASSNNPPARGETNSSWVDDNNCLWLFGGFNGNTGLFSDLWKYDISTNQWVWIKGPNTTNQTAIYGTKGIPNINNIPSARYCHAKWKDNNGDFWIFAGEITDSLSNIYFLNDLWRFDITSNEWTWISGDSIAFDSATVGSRCVPSINNIPAARSENRACWLLNNDNFGGFGGLDNYNDLWNYNVVTNEWTWMSGSIIPNQNGSYGTRLISNQTNVPSSRGGSIGWKDNFGNLWLFGGMDSGYNNDMWRFIPNTLCPLLTSIPARINTPPQISLYPNPTSGTFTLSYHPSTPNAAFQLFDISGRVVYTHTISGTIGKEIIDASALSNGMYFYQLTSASETWQGKVVVEK